MNKITRRKQLLTVVFAILVLLFLISDDGTIVHDEDTNLSPLSGPQARALKVSSGYNYSVPRYNDPDLLQKQQITAYPTHSYGNKSGKTFNFSADDIINYRLIPNQYAQPLWNSATWMDSFEFVTGASDNHVLESVGLIDSIQRHFPAKRVIYYDLGIHDNMYVKMIQCWRNVEYRKFDFTKYPDHVRLLRVYSFKAIIIKELLNEDNIPGVFWVDASIRFNNSNLSQIRTVLERTGGICMPLFSGYHAGIFIHSGMYDYIQTNQSQMYELNEYEGGGFIVYNTKFMYDNILQYLYFCAFEEACIAPEGATKLCWQYTYKNRQVTIPLCHRYDQSLLNILLGNLYDFNHTVYGIDWTHQYSGERVDPRILRYNNCTIRIPFLSWRNLYLFLFTARKSANEKNLVINSM